MSIGLADIRGPYHSLYRNGLCLLGAGRGADAAAFFGRAAGASIDVAARAEAQLWRTVALAHGGLVNDAEQALDDAHRMPADPPAPLARLARLSIALRGAEPPRDPEPIDGVGDGTPERELLESEHAVHLLLSRSPGHALGYIDGLYDRRREGPVVVGADLLATRRAWALVAIGQAPVAARFLTARPTGPADVAIPALATAQLRKGHARDAYILATRTLSRSRLSTALGLECGVVRIAAQFRLWEASRARHAVQALTAATVESGYWFAWTFAPLEVRHFAASMSEVAAEVLERLPQQVPDTAVVPALSHRELMVLDALAARMTRRETATLLGVSLNTVKTHRANLYRKLGVNDRSSALYVAADSGLLDSAKSAS